MVYNCLRNGGADTAFLLMKIIVRIVCAIQKANDFSLTALIFQSRATIIMRTLVHKHLYILMPIFS